MSESLKQTLNIASTVLPQTEATEFQMMCQKNEHVVWVRRLLSLSMIQMNYYYYLENNKSIVLK